MGDINTINSWGGTGLPFLGGSACPYPSELTGNELVNGSEQKNYYTKSIKVS